MGKSVQELITEAKARIENLGNDQVEAELAEGAVLVDIREPVERQDLGVIPGALHTPWQAAQADPVGAFRALGLEPDQRVIVHCAAGNRSALATEALRRAGWTNVAHLDPGFNGWASAGKPVERV